MYRIPAIMIAAALVMAGCSFEDPCEFGSCLGPDGGTANNATTNSQTGGNATSNGMPNGQTGGNVATNSSTANAQTGSNIQTGPNVEPGPDAGMTSPNNMPAPQCEVDVFSFDCAPDEYEINDVFPHYLGTTGCPGQGGEFRPLDIVVDARVCPLEQIDLFDVNIASCDRDVTLEITLELENECRDELWEFVVPNCSDPDLTCNLSADGRTVTLVQRARAVGLNSPRFGVETKADIFVDYRIRARTY